MGREYCLDWSMLKRIFGVAALLLASLASFGQAAPEKKAITIWGLSISADDKGTDSLVRAFEAKYPQYRVRLLGMGAGGMNPQKLMTAIVGGVPPDVVRQDRFTISDWASRGAFREMDDLIARDAGKDPNTPKQDDYYPAVWNEAVYEGKLYGVPIAADNRVLYYNKKIFARKADVLRKAGLDPNRPPRTWSETLAYSKVLTEFNKNGTLKTAGFMPNFGNSWLYLFAFQMNAQFLSPDGKTCTINSPQTKKALQFMIDGYDLLGGYVNADRFQSTFRGEENDPFLTDQVAMMVNGDWILSGFFRYKPGHNFGTAPAPVPDDRYNQTGEFKNEKDKFITWTGGFAYTIPRGAKNTDGAWEFIKFATSFEGRMLDMRAQQKYEQSRGRRYIPKINGMKSVNDQAMKEFASGNTPFDEACKTHVSMMGFARIRPASFAAQYLWDEHVRAIERGCRKANPGDTPDQVLADAQKNVQRILDEENNASQYPVIDLRIPFAIGGGIIALFVGAVAWYVFSRKQGRIGRTETLWGYIFISPWIVGFLVFTLGPMLASLFFSFTQYNVLNPARWVGLKNYQDLLSENGDRAVLIKALSNIVYLAGFGIPLGLIAGLGIALLLNSKVKGMRYYRTAFFLPSVVPTVVIVILWMFILSADPARGLVNSGWQKTISEWFGGATPNWFGDENWTKPSLILMGLWGAGGGMILWLAGLKGIPASLYEAASIDGANPRQQFWSITLPNLSHLIFFSTIMGFIGTLQTFDSIYVITKGENAGANDSLMVPVYHLFVNGFKYFRMGYASALAWLIFLVILIVTGIQFLMSRKWVHLEVKD